MTGSRHAHVLVTCMEAVHSDTARYGEAAMDPVPASPPRWAVPTACRWRYEDPYLDPHDHPKPTLTTILPLHGPLGLRAGILARGFPCLLGISARKRKWPP